MDGKMKEQNHDKQNKQVVTEALRYLGVGKNPPEELRRRVEKIFETLSMTVQPRWVWKQYCFQRKDSSFFLLDEGGQQTGQTVPKSPPFLSGLLSLSGQTAETMLSDCTSVVLLACTLGAGYDARLRAAQVRDMADAVILDACGSAWVEAGCDRAEAEIAARFPGRYLTDRFSPGYGDLSLSLQRDICTLLDTPRRLGVHVTDSFLMNPAKSVTAVVGISDRPQMARVRGCAYCAMRENCSLRKAGDRCAI